MTKISYYTPDGSLSLMEEYDNNGLILHSKTLFGESFYENGLLIKKINDGKETLYTYEYDSRGNIVREVGPGTRGRRVRVFEYDLHDNLIYDSDYILGLSQWWLYDSNDNVVFETNHWYQDEDGFLYSRDYWESGQIKTVKKYIIGKSPIFPKLFELLNKPIIEEFSNMFSNYPFKED